MNSSQPPVPEDPPVEIVEFISRRALVAMTSHEAGQPCVFMPSTATVTVGQAVRVKVVFSDCSKRFALAGVVTAKQVAGEERSPGFDLLMSQPHERRAWSSLFAFCSRNQEAARRFESSIWCTIDTGHAQHEGLIRDLSMTGAFLAFRGGSAVPAGSAVAIVMKSGLFGLGTIKIDAEVVWSGSKNDMAGVGAQFIGATPAVIKLMKKYNFGRR